MAEIRKKKKNLFKYKSTVANFQKMAAKRAASEDVSEPSSLSKEERVQTRGYEKERTSILISADLARAVRAKCRAAGISFNAFMSEAAYDKLYPPSSLPSSVQPHSVIHQHITNVQPRPPVSSSPEEKLAKFGRFWQGDPDPDGGGRPSATWDDCIRYNRAVVKLAAKGEREIPNYVDMGQRLGMTRQTALAASMAYDDARYAEYMNLRYGNDVWDHFLERTQDVVQKEAS